MKQRNPDAGTTEAGAAVKSNTISPAVVATLRERLDSSHVDFDRLRRQRRTLRRVLERLSELDFTTRSEDTAIAGILHLLESL